MKIPQRPLNYVVDLANIIDEKAEKELNRYLFELERKTTVQMAILTVESLKGTPIEEFSLYVAHDLWKLGKKGKDNGILLVISLKDRMYRFEVGYGLEEILPDSLLGTIGRTYLVPYFREGKYSTGIFLATLSVIKIISAHQGVEIKGLPSFESRKGMKTIVFLGFFIPVILFLLLGFNRRRGRFFFFPVFFPSGGGFGGFGEFGGGGIFGGGGGFGGGGVTGRW